MKYVDAAVTLAWQLTAAGHADGMVTEHRFDAVRRWRFDIAWPDRLFAVEVEGGNWIGGHAGRRFEADMDKYNAAALAGWRVLRFTPRMVDDGRAIDVIVRGLGLDNAAARR